MEFKSEAEAKEYVRNHYDEMERDRYGAVNFTFTIEGDDTIRDASDPLFAEALSNWTDVTSLDPVKYGVGIALALMLVWKVL
jgi:hypothetical protein